MSIVYFIIALGVLILIHELGHFIMARRNGIRVENFSIGFGPKILGFKKGETEYKIAPLPLGGYIKMTGEDPSEATSNDPKSFANKSVWTRVRVVAAGPIMNLIFAFILMPIVFLVGRMEPVYLEEPPVIIGVKKDSPAMAAGFQVGDLIKSIDDKKITKWEDALNQIFLSTGKDLRVEIDRGGKNIDTTLTVGSMPELKGGYAGIEPLFFMGNEAIIDQVVPGGPAASAGIKAGDKVLATDDKKIADWAEMTSSVHDSAGKAVKFTIERKGAIHEMDVTPVYDDSFKKWMIGIRKDIKPSDVPMIKRKYGLIEAAKKGFDDCINLIGLTFEVLKKLFTFQLSYKALGGPIQIANASITAAKYGLAEFIYFMAFLSIQLGILNLLPIPILDGGHVLFCAIEGAIRRPLSVRIRSYAQYFGLALILAIFLLVTVNDIDSIWGIKSLLGKLF